MKEKIAVLLSTFNGEKYIREQVESILNQKTDCELYLIIRDDGSTDNTLGVLEELSKNEERITIIRGENIRGVASFFTLIKYAVNHDADFDYFSLADQDDVWDDDKIQVGVDFIRKNEKTTPVLYGSASRPVDVDMNPLPRKNKKNKPITFYNTIIQCFIPGHTQMFNKALATIIYKADPSQIYVHDSFILNAAILCGKLIYDKNPHVNYRQHSANQLGTSQRGIVGWVSSRIKRLINGDGRRYARQIEYIFESFKSNMTTGQVQEMTRFLTYRSNVIKRVLYSITKKVYRQGKLEDFVFRLLYLLGGYNLD